MYYIDKKIHPGYQRPRIIFGRGLFCKKLFKNTLLDGELVKCKDNTWTFLINDIVCYEGLYLNNKTLLQRLDIIYNMLETQYTPDSTIDVCNYKVKCYYNMFKESIYELQLLSKNLNYTCRGIYIWPYDLKYKPKLYNFDETSVIDVVRKTKDITEFKTFYIDLNNTFHNDSIISNQTISSPNNKNNENNENSKALYLMKTIEPDIYNIYETENSNDKSIGIALVQSIKDSKLLRTAFRDKNAITFIKFACIYDDKFNKWKVLYKL